MGDFILPHDVHQLLWFSQQWLPCHLPPILLSLLSTHHSTHTSHSQSKAKCQYQKKTKICQLSIFGYVRFIIYFPKFLFAAVFIPTTASCHNTSATQGSADNIGENKISQINFAKLGKPSIKKGNSLVLVGTINK